jgi:hypothetical protein
MRFSVRNPWVRRILRPTPRRLAVFAVLAVMIGLYQLYFTPEKRMVRHRLCEADTKCETAINTRLEPLTEMFAKARRGAKAFAEEALSWDSKWQLLKGTVRGDESHRRFLSEAFTRHIFSSDDLRVAMESAVRTYLDDIEGYEAEMLVLLRADLADLSEPGDPRPPHLGGDELFRTEYRKLSGLVLDELHLDIGVTVGRELGLMVASDIAAQIAMQAARAAATEMGINAGVLSTGVASTVATLGLGMIAAIILDYVLDEVFKMAGYDPAAKIEALVCESINKMESALTGNWAPFSSRKTGSLRLRMEQLHESRSKLRRETIARLLNEGGK